MKIVVVTLCNAIIANVPEYSIFDLKDSEYNYNEVHPHTILTHIIANAEPVSVLDAKQLKALHDTSLTFDGNKNLATQFVAIQKIMDELKRIHGIATSETEMMMECLFSIEQQTDSKTKPRNDERRKQTPPSMTSSASSLIATRESDASQNCDPKRRPALATAELSTYATPTARSA